MQLQIYSTQGRGQMGAGWAKTLSGNALASLAMAQLVGLVKGSKLHHYSLFAAFFY